jgi:hypothetical protein
MKKYLNINRLKVKQALISSSITKKHLEINTILYKLSFDKGLFSLHNEGQNGKVNPRAK